MVLRQILNILLVTDSIWFGVAITTAIEVDSQEFGGSFWAS